MSENLKKLIEIQRDYFTPQEVAPILGCSPMALRYQAKEHPEKLPFKVLVLGTRVRILRASFLACMGYEEEVPETIRILPKSSTKTVKLP